VPLTPVGVSVDACDVDGLEVFENWA
jgi:hypothetical protein